MPRAATRVLPSLGIILLILIAFTSVARADVLTDPEVLHIGTGLGTACQQGGCPVFGGEVNGIGATALDVWENGNGQPTLNSPLLLFIGIPNSTTGAPTSLTLSTGTGMLGGTDVYGGTWDTSTGFAGNFTGTASSCSSATVYECAGVNDGSSSESFGNWAAAELAVNSITATSFGIFVYTLSNTGLTGGSGVGVTFGSGLPFGTFVVAYDCNTSTIPCPHRYIFATPFTESGINDSGQTPPPPPPVPEPGSLSLIATAMLAGAFFLYRKRSLRST